MSVEVPSFVATALSRVRGAPAFERRGRVSQLVGLTVESEGPVASVGDLCRITPAGGGPDVLAEVVGFRQDRLLLMPLSSTRGISPGSEVRTVGRPLSYPCGPGLKGRVLNGLGDPIDDAGPLLGCPARELHQASGVTPPLQRQRITKPFNTRIKVLDTLIPCGQGQRLGIMAGSGVGKSTLLGMMAGQAEADVNVIALIGERGREVREFLERDLSEIGRQRSVVVVATSDEPAMVRLKGAFLAMDIAAYFRDQGLNTLFMMDSVTRFAMAQREIGLSAGEPPATRGYPPSVFALLPQLLEQAGNSALGSMTAFFTILTESDDLQDPVADACRAILDGHVVLSRELANAGHYPAIDVLGSVSRLNSDLLSAAERRLGTRLREWMSLYRKNQDLIQIGAYTSGTQPTLDAAIRAQDAINAFLRQDEHEGVETQKAWQMLQKVLS
ncbi:MAG: FliI/YscN family ATPase [Verrucomicrobia bacterium]|nr:FliI/YscN family ATPase [Verrucomicrobiota bacterium]